MQLVRGETTVADAADWARADRSTPDWQTDWQLVPDADQGLRGGPDPGFSWSGRPYSKRRPSPWQGR